jgi:carboxyl-terminal processing protease
MSIIKPLMPSKSNFPTVFTVVTIIGTLLFSAQNSSAQTPVKNSPELSNHNQDYFEISKNLDIFNALYRELNAKYVDGTKPGQLMKNGIEAMLNSLDPYTNYYTENDIEDYRFMTTGQYGGIGSSVIDVDGKITIADPHEGFAAQKAGLRSGDQIVGINNNNVEGKRTEDIGSLLKGTAGSPIKLKVIKAGGGAPVEYNLVREEIKTPAVAYFGMLKNKKTGIIKLHTFTENCSVEVKNALIKLKEQGCTSLILDLRGNLGGLLHEAVNIVNFFIDKNKEVVSTKGRIPDWDKTYFTLNNPIDVNIPLVVLVDESSASASEIVCGALQDLDRAVILGKRTFGKGLVQQTSDLVYNAKVKITVAKYYIPSGRCVQALDYSNKNEEGRVEKVPDSLITAFKTKGGRIVYDGAGIMPDIRTEEEKYSDILIALVSKHHIFNFATKYSLAHKEIAPAQDFSLTEGEFSEFLEYLKDKNYDYKTNAEIRMDDLRKQAEDEKVFSEFITEYYNFMNKIQSNKKEDLSRYRDEIKKYLEEEIAARYYFQKGRIECSIKADPDIVEASRLLADTDKIKIILSLIEKPTKPFNVNKRF